MRTTLCTVGGLVMVLVGASGASAAGVAANLAGGFPDQKPGTIIQKVHSLYAAKQTLYGLGYYDVRVERASLPYSFTACKRGARYHIHVDYYGDLVEVDEVGACREYDNGHDDYEYRNRRYRYPRYDN
jgi:hypothetical protein